MRAVVSRYRYPRPTVRVDGRPGTGTLYFLTPDWNTPSGGVRVIYRHVDLLNAAGSDAVVLHQKRGFRCTWFENDTRITDVGSVVLGDSDVLVVPELDLDVVANLGRPVRHIVLNQSGHLTWRREPDVVSAHYRSSEDLLGMIAVSEHSEGLLRYAFPERTVRRVRLSLDPAVFGPGAPSAPRTRTLAYLPRRGGVEVGQVLAMLGSRGVLGSPGVPGARGVLGSRSVPGDGSVLGSRGASGPSGVPGAGKGAGAWTLRALSGLTQRQLADAMRQGMMVLSTSYQEGFGLPAVEAMACGNYVVGFHGFGGREFFRPEFSTAAETGDVVAVARAVEAAITAEAADPGWCLARGRAASEFVLATYTPAHERDDVLTAYRDLLAADPRVVELMPRPRRVDDSTAEMSTEPGGAS